MTQITIRISGASAESHRTGPLTAGMVGVPVQFIFGPEWDDITAITAVFEAGDLARDRELIKDSSGLFQTTIPHEVLAKPNTTLMIGVEGRKSDGSIIIPTTWSRVGTILRGATSTGAPSLAPTPTQYDRILQKIGNLDELKTENKDSIVVAINELDKNVVGMYMFDDEDVVAPGEVFNNYEKNVAINLGHAQNDYTHAGWRSHTEGYGTYADNTSHAGGRLSKATGKGSFAHGKELTLDLLVNGTQVVTTAEVALDSVNVPVSISIVGALNVGDFITLYSAGMIATDCRRVSAISKDGLTITIEHPFLDIHYTTAIDGEESANIPAGVRVRVAVGCEASGEGAVAVGINTNASGSGALAEGDSNTASGYCSHAEGKSTQATGNYSHTEGEKTTASGYYTHAEGYGTVAINKSAHAEGENTVASGFRSHAEGQGTIAAGSNQHVQGKYNIADIKRDAEGNPVLDKNGKEQPANTYAHIVGNGTSNTKRSNAHTLDWNGNAWFAGKVTAGADPTEDMDLVTLKYLKGALGDIEALLAAI